MYVIRYLTVMGRSWLDITQHCCYAARQLASGGKGRAADWILADRLIQAVWPTLYVLIINGSALSSFRPVDAVLLYKAVLRITAVLNQLKAFD